MLLAVEDIGVSYGRIAAVRGVSLSIDDGEIVCITGPNGAGKSSSLLAIAGAVPVTQGRILIDGADVAGLVPEIIARKGVSLVPEGRHIFSRLTVEENLVLGTSTRNDRREMAVDLDKVLNQFPILRSRRRSIAGTLSGGEQQQLAIGRALLSKPKILLLDEPSLGLAPKIIDQVYQIIIDLRRSGVTLLIVEESMSRALDIADRVYVMASGSIELSGESAELARLPQLQDAYFGLTNGDTGVQ